MFGKGATNQHAATPQLFHQPLQVKRVGDVRIAQNRDLTVHEPLWRDTLGQGPGVPDLHAAREYLHPDPAAKVGVIAVREGIHQRFTQRRIRVGAAVLTHQGTGPEVAKAARVATNKGKHLIEHGDQRPLEIREIPVYVVRLVRGKRRTAHPRLRVARCRIAGKQHIPAVGQSPVLHQAQALKGLHRAV